MICVLDARSSPQAHPRAAHKAHTRSFTPGFIILFGTPPSRWPTGQVQPNRPRGHLHGGGASSGKPPKGCQQLPLCITPILLSKRGAHQVKQAQRPTAGRGARSGKQAGGANSSGRGQRHGGGGGRRQREIIMFLCRFSRVLTRENIKMNKNIRPLWEVVNPRRCHWLPGLFGRLGVSPPRLPGESVPTQGQEAPPRICLVREGEGWRGGPTPPPLSFSHKPGHPPPLVGWMLWPLPHALPRVISPLGKSVLPSPPSASPLGSFPRDPLLHPPPHIPSFPPPSSVGRYMEGHMVQSSLPGKVFFFQTGVKPWIILLVIFLSQ